MNRYVALVLGFGLFYVSACKDSAAEADDLALVEKSTQASYTLFESGQVRPLALAPSGDVLYALNTPDNRLETYTTAGAQLTALGSVRVGLEPVAVAVRDGNEVWVVNHLSDSISIVDATDPARPFIRRTLLVGDEPRDIVFAGVNETRAFITTAHRGQNTGRDPQLTTPGVGRADVWVFDAGKLGAPLTGTPFAVLTLFSDTPRALAVTPDGATVYAAAFHSGNRTTSLMERVVTPNGGMPPPSLNAEGQQQPNTGLIVKFRPDPTDAGVMHWLDAAGRRWDAQVKLSLPDRDVFTIDALATPPAVKADQAYTGVGTTLFAMAVNPRTGKVYVANTDAHNDVRFEGHNVTGPTQNAPTGSVRGHIAESRLSVLSSTTEVATRHLNKHLDDTRDGTEAEAQDTLAQPVALVASQDGDHLFVAAFGSSKVGIFSTAELEDDSFLPDADTHVTVSGGGPAGLALDHQRGVLYVLTRFDNGVSVVDLRSREERSHVQMFNPEPANIVRGRRFLYDTARSSSNGEASCASCHVFGDLDALAWDLGDPDAADKPMPGPYTFDANVFMMLGAPPAMFQSNKGPMTTQSLRGLANHGPMHWRGDRTGGGSGVENAQPDTGTFDESAAFERFNVAFTGLLGRAEELPASDMQAFTEFVLQITYPPNPIRSLDNSLTPDEQAGRDFYDKRLPNGDEDPTDRFHNCNGCHTLDPQGNAEYGVAKPGFFGTNGRYSFPGAPQWMKVPHLRNAYQKVGMFGMTAGFDPNQPLMATFLPAPFNDESHMGEQVRGFGYLHDGSTDTLFRLHGLTSFVAGPAFGPLPANPSGIPAITDPENLEQTQRELEANFKLRRQVEAFLFAFDSNVAPIVGQQVTAGASADDAVAARVALLEGRANAGDCELVAHVPVDGTVRGYVYSARTHRFLSDRQTDPALTSDKLLALSASTPVTFTAVPLGSGVRIGVDRDLNGTRDADER